MSYNSKYTGAQVEEFLDQIANGEIGGDSSVYKWNWNSEMNGTFTEEEFENLSNADVVYITTGVAGMEMLYSVDGRVVIEDALHLGIHILSFETDTDNSEVAYVESMTFIFDNASKTWSVQGGNAELITNEQLTSALEDKQDNITDLDAIRSGAEKGATALQSVPSEYVTKSELTNKGYATTSALNNKVDKVSGKQLSTEDFTSALKSKLEGLSNYDDTELSNALSILRGDFDKLVSGDTTTAIKTFNEVISFLDGIQDTQDLSSIIASIEQQIAGKYTKPSGGIPASDLAPDVFLQGEKGDKGDKGDTGANGTNGKDGADGEDGATFTPSVDANGNLSWTNNKGLSNPPTVNIKGPKGDSGEGGGSSGGKEIVEVALQNGSISFMGQGDRPSFEPNKIYYTTTPVIETVTVISVIPPTEGIGEYSLHFSYREDAFMFFEVPSDWLWPNGIPAVEAGVSYELSVVATKFGSDYIYKAVLTPFKPVE